MFDEDLNNVMLFGFGLSALSIVGVLLGDYALIAPAIIGTFMVAFAVTLEEPQDELPTQ